MEPVRKALSSIELCTGAGGQALGLESAGFDHLAVVEIDAHACATLRLNRPTWNTVEGDVRAFDSRQYEGVDLLAAGVPCPPFSVAGHQLGAEDERDMFPDVIRIAAKAKPRAILIENVPGLMKAKFADYRNRVQRKFERLGYRVSWTILNASDFGVPQLRPRALMIAIDPECAAYFSWPTPIDGQPPTVGKTLRKDMAARGWSGAKEWSLKANSIAPTLVGGSKKHGGPDLGPTRARTAWEKLGVDGRTIADAAPDPDQEGMPRLTVGMAAKIQGFPADWVFTGGKTSAYRQVGNAFPPPVAKAVGLQLADALGREGAEGDFPETFYQAPLVEMAT